MLSALFIFFIISLAIQDGLWFQTNSLVLNLVFNIILIHCLLLNTYVFLINFEYLVIFVIYILCKCIILWIIFLLDFVIQHSSWGSLQLLRFSSYIQYICMKVVEIIFLLSIWWTLMFSGFFAHISSAIISILSLFCLRKYN